MRMSLAMGNHRQHLPVKATEIIYRIAPMGILTKSKNGFYAIPAIASAIFPGLGQIIKRQYGKGIVFLAIFFGWGLITFLPSLLPLSGLLIPIAAVVAWLINVLDAAFNSVGQRY
jgi:TM2 domain-containing membrane protein YozV